MGKVKSNSSLITSDKLAEKRLKKYSRMGLESQVSIPFILNELHNYIASSSNTFFWLDDNFQVKNIYDERPFAEGKASLIENFISNLFQNNENPWQVVTSRYRKAVGLETIENQAINREKRSYTKPNDQVNIDATKGVLLPIWGDDCCHGVLILYRNDELEKFSDKEIKAINHLLDIFIQAFNRPQSIETKFVTSNNERDLAVVIAGQNGEIKSMSEHASAFIHAANNPRITNRKARKVKEIKLPKQVLDLCKNIDGPNSNLWHHANRWGEFTFRKHRVNNFPCSNEENLLSITIERDIPVQQFLTEKLEAHDLSPREHQIGLWIALGFKMKDIATLLHVSENTVITHRQNLYRKMNINNRGELISQLLL